MDGGLLKLALRHSVSSATRDALDDGGLAGVVGVVAGTYSKLNICMQCQQDENVPVVQTVRLLLPR